jgi:hypothetical protein
MVQLPPLARTADGRWQTWFTASRPDTLTASLVIDGRVTQTMALQVLDAVAGINPYFINYDDSAAAATLTTQNMASTSPAFSGAVTMLYTNQSSLLSVPVLDAAERRWVSSLLGSGSFYPRCTYNLLLHAG